MQRDCKISVIVPTYNRNHILCETLELLFKQDYKNYEIVVVDQSESHDAYTTEYLRSNEARVRHLSFQPPNLPAARNYGIDCSKGEIVVFCDDDMVLPSNTISSLASAYSFNDTWGATGFVISPGMSEAEKIASHTVDAKTRQLLAKPDALVRIRECIGCLMSFRRELFHRIGYFDGWLGTQPMGAGEDLEFTTRMSLRGYGLFLVTDLTVTHLGAKSGGCERRTLAPKLVDKAQLRVAAYCYLKNRRYEGTLGWADALWRCCRTFVLNRNVLRAGFKVLLSRLILAVSIVPEMVSVVKRNLDDDSTNSFPANRYLTTSPERAATNPGSSC